MPTIKPVDVLDEAIAEANARIKAEKIAHEEALSARIKARATSRLERAFCEEVAIAALRALVEARKTYQTPSLDEWTHAEEALARLDACDGDRP